MSTTTITLAELADLIGRATGVKIDTEQLLEPSVTFGDLTVDSLGRLGVLSELERRFGLDPESDELPSDTVYALLHGCYRRLVTAGRLESGLTEQAVVIDAPYREVWEQTNDVPAWPELFSEYASAEILERSGDTVTFRLTMHPDENGAVWSWVSARTVDAATGTVRARRVETGPFAFMTLLWTYREVPGGVELRWRQEFAMKPDAPLDTPAMTARISANSTFQLELIRGRVEERARRRAA